MPPVQDSDHIFFGLAVPSRHLLPRQREKVSLHGAYWEGLPTCSHSSRSRYQRLRKAPPPTQGHQNAITRPLFLHAEIRQFLSVIFPAVLTDHQHKRQKLVPAGEMLHVGIAQALPHKLSEFEVVEMFRQLHENVFVLVHLQPS